MDVESGTYGEDETNLEYIGIGTLAYKMSWVSAGRSATKWPTRLASLAGARVRIGCGGSGRERAYLDVVHHGGEDNVGWCC